MTFDEILTRVITLLQQEGRVSYRALQIRFNLDDEYLEGLKDELIEAKQLAADERGKVLVWTGEGETGKRGKTVGCLAIRTRPYRGAARRSPWSRMCLTPLARLSPYSLLPNFMSAAWRGNEPKSRQR